MSEEVILHTGKERFLFFLEENRMAILIGFALVCVAVIILVTALWLERQNRSQSLSLEGKAQQLYMDRSLKEPEQSKEHVKEAAKMYKKVVDQYPRTVSAQIALYQLGNSLYEGHDYNGAIQAYTKFLTDFQSNGILRGLVSQRLGYAYLVKGEGEQAQHAFSAVLKMSGALNKDQTLIELGKLAEADPTKEKALNYYQQLVEQFPSSPYASEASIRIKTLKPEEATTPSKPSSGEPAQPSQKKSGTKEEKKGNGLLGADKQ